MYAVFLFPPDAQARAREVTEDDLISRQSVTSRDAQALGTGREGLLVVVEGDERALHRFEELAPEARRLKGREGEEAYRRLKAEEEDAASGVGFLFGG